MALMLCFVSICSLHADKYYYQKVCFGNLDEVNYDFVLGVEMNGKTLIWNTEFNSVGASTPIIAEIINDSIISVNSNCSLYLLGRGICRDSDNSYLTTISTGTTSYAYGKRDGYISCGAKGIGWGEFYAWNINVDSITGKIIIYTKTGGGYSLWFEYTAYRNIFCYNYINVDVNNMNVSKKIGGVNVYKKIPGIPNVATNIDDDVKFQKVFKIIRIYPSNNGQLLIINGDKVYDVFGRLVLNGFNE